MKLVKSLSLVAAFAAASVASHAAAIGAANDLIVGFYQAGVTQDIEFNAGKLDLSNLLSVGTHDLGNWATLLNSTFGTDWSGVSFAAVGAQNKTTAGGFEYITSAQSTSGVSGAFGTPVQSAINVGLGKVQQVYAGTVTGNLIGAGTTNAFDKSVPFNFTNSPVANKIGNVVNSGTFAASDLYLLHGALDTTVSVIGTQGLQGTLAVYQNGDVTFTVIPEPSTYAAILGALTIGFVALRRRFSNVAV